MKKASGFFYTFLVFFLIWIIYVIIEYHIANWLLNDGHIRIVRASSTLSSLSIIVLTVFIYPLLEETIFRLPISAKPKHIFLSLLVAIWYYPTVYNFFISKEGILQINRFIIPSLLTAILCFVFYKVSKSLRYQDHLSKIKVLPLVMALVFIFTIGHFWRLEYDSLLNLIIFLFVVYFSLGLFLSYVRLKLGFWSAVMFHVLQNSAPYIVILYYSLKKGENLFIYL